MIGSEKARQVQKELLFLKKKKQKDFWLSPAFERPDLGPSKARETESFFGYFFFKKSNFFLLTFCLSLLVHHQAHADAATEAALRAALQQAATQIAALQDQVANLQAAQAPNVAMIEALRAKLQNLQGAAPGGTTESAADKAKAAADKAKAEAALAALSKQLAARDAALAKSQSQYAAATTTAQSEAAQITAFKAQVASLQTNVSVCDTKNAQLYALANKILDAYSHKDDVFNVIANHEPFIGFSRVQLQNIVQEDQDKLDAAQLPTSGGN